MATLPPILKRRKNDNTMAINNFRIISYDAAPEKSINNFQEIMIENVRVLVQSEIIERRNILIIEACVFIEIASKWISAVYEKAINPSISEDYDSFMNDLKALAIFLLQSTPKSRIKES